MAEANGELIIMDNGSKYLKAGFVSDDKPRFKMPVLTGRKQYTNDMGVKKYEYYFGGEAHDKRELLNLSYPIEHGIVKDWDSMEVIWSNALNNELRIIPENHPVLLTETPSNPKKCRQKMFEMFFETFNVPACYIYLQGILSLYGSGGLTGIAVDSGDGVTQILPVKEGWAIRDAVKCIPELAGRTVTDCLSTLLSAKNNIFDAKKMDSTILKERLCYIAQDYDKEMQVSQQSTDISESYKMPDGQALHVSSERFRAPEILFKPSLIGSDIGGIHEHIYESVQRCDIDIRNDLLKHIVLSGGNTMFPGLAERLQNEVKTMVSSDGKANPAEVKVLAPENRKYLSWIGGSIIGSLSTFKNLMITQDKYYERGPRCIDTMLFI